jgi:tripartite-type tricarboxylate transporter receptor subunit TctC
MIFARALAAALLATCTLATGAVSAQSYPDRPVTMIVAFPPGGADDATARFIQDAHAESAGQADRDRKYRRSWGHGRRR